jgi:hypothetical protein
VAPAIVTGLGLLPATGGEAVPLEPTGYVSEPKAPAALLPILLQNFPSAIVPAGHAASHATKQPESNPQTRVRIAKGIEVALSVQLVSRAGLE